MCMNDIEKLQKFIDESNNIVFFGGAGVSTESGIKDFRSNNGLLYWVHGVGISLIISVNGEGR